MIRELAWDMRHWESIPSSVTAFLHDFKQVTLLPFLKIYGSLPIPPHKVGVRYVSVLKTVKCSDKGTHKAPMRI